jgi:uncharacterized protein with von Willebrand factor type A (vWA) domain
MSLLENLLTFGRLLKRAGIDTHAGRTTDVVEALSHVNLDSRDEVYHASRALLVHRKDQIPIFDIAFDAFWRAHRNETIRNRRRDENANGGVSVVDMRGVVESGETDSAPDDDSTDPERVATWSDRGGTANRDFAELTVEELAEARRALARLAWNPGERRTRRWVRGRGARVDLRRAIAESLRTGGDVVRLPRRRRRIRPRPLVLLCDVSGSMERYSRMLLQFAHALTRRHQRVETFLFSTRLTRVTRELRISGPDDALAAVSRAVTDWSGGTRIGQAVREFHQRWSRRVLHRGPVVLLISDGWDRGDPVELGEQIARLQRSCHRLVWLNPLIGTPDYAPLTRGLQAALPFVDDFLPARTLNNLADLAVHLNALARPAQTRLRRTSR